MKHIYCIIPIIAILFPSVCDSQNNTIEFRLAYDTECEKCKSMQYLNMASGKTEALYVGEVELSDKDVEDTEVKEGSYDYSPTLILHFNEDGRNILSNLTSKNINKKLAIIVRGEIITAPVIRERIDGGVAHITGNLALEDVLQIEKQIKEHINE